MNFIFLHHKLTFHYVKDKATTMRKKTRKSDYNVLQVHLHKRKWWLAKSPVLDFLKDISSLSHFKSTPRTKHDRADAEEQMLGHWKSKVLIFILEESNNGFHFCWKGTTFWILLRGILVGQIQNAPLNDRPQAIYIENGSY